MGLALATRFTPSDCHAPGVRLLDRATKGAGAMSTRRDVALGLVIAGAGSALAGKVAQAQAEVSEAEALEALDPWADALFTGDPAAVDQVLAEEFQILRPNGRGHDKASYLKT